MTAGWSRKLLLLLMLLSLTGGQWALLQSAAWAGMLANRLRTERIPQAITTTFDGQHPCPLCKAVQSGRKSESKSEVVTKVPRVEFPPTESCCIPTAASNGLFTIAWADESAESLSIRPPLRPPRSISL